MEKRLSKIYYDTENPAGYSTAYSLWKACEKKYSITRIRNWLQSQNTFTLHKQRQTNFKRQRYYVTNIADLYQADLCDLRNLAKENDNMKYILTVIDVFSKRAWAIPIINKTATEIIKAFKIVFQTRKPIKLQTDKGTEFLAKPVQTYLKENSVNFFTSNQPAVKASICERFNRTLKTKMWKYFTYSGSYRYIDVLPKLVNAYNGTKHSSTGLAPKNVCETNILEVWRNLYGGFGRYKKITFSSTPVKTYMVGDSVRIAKEKFTFEKGFSPNWTDEIFKISKVLNTSPVTYEIVDLNNEKILGKFYEKEIQMVSVNKKSTFEIDKILKTKGKGNSRMLLVRWRGYSEKFDSWISIHFSHVLHLPGNWEVAIKELHFPMTMSNIRAPNNTLDIILEKKHVRIIIPEKYYSNIHILTEILNKMCQNYVRFDVQNNGLVTTKFVNKTNSKMECHLPLALKRQLGYLDATHLDGGEKQAFHIPSINRGLPQALHLHTNLIKPQNVNGNFENLIKIVPIDFQKYEYGCYYASDFSSPSYLPVAREKFDVIEMDISDEQNNSLSFAFGISTIVLHFRKVTNRIQKGEGLGSFLSNIFRTVLPLFKSGAKAVGKQALSTGVGLLKDALNGKPVKESFRNRVTEAGQNLTNKAATKVEQMVGNGYKRGIKRKLPQSRGSAKRGKISKRRSAKSRKKRRSTNNRKKVIYSVKMKSYAIEGLPTELDIFSPPVIQTGILDGNWYHYKPTSSILDSRQITFVVPGNGDQYVDLSRTILVFKFQIVKANGQAYDAQSVVGGVNNFFDSVISDVKVEFNNKIVSNSMHMYHYRSYIEDLYNYNITAKSSHLTASLWEQDVAGSMHALNQASYVKRLNRTKSSAVFELAGKIHCDLFSAQKLLLNGVDIRLTLLKNKPEVCLMGAAADDPMVKFLDATLLIRRVDISPSIKLAHNKALSVHKAKYPFKKVEMQSVTLPQGTRQQSIENLFLGRIPARIIVGLVSNAGYNGDLTKNPYSFEHYNLNHLSLIRNGQQVLSRPYTPMYTGTEKTYTLPYIFSFIGTGINFSDDGYCVSLTEYPSGYCLYAFDLTPDLSANSTHWCPQIEGNLRLELGFNDALPEAVSVILYAEYREILEIDKNRECSTEYGS
ncbi:hypothetical protein B566_EDAN008751 [Ephemera danica]|nr:hypothetical protein B566_EDAN008751 [Ephemera danica]